MYCAHVVLAAVTCLAAGPRMQAAGESGPAPAESASSVADWGVEIVGVRLSAAGRMIDFRYRVTDADKAMALLGPENKAYLVDQENGVRLYVPNTPKLGPLRQTAKGGAAVGRTYFTLFSNLGGLVRAGDKVTIVIGDFRVEGLTVE
ncbi:MAG: hypothetical protein JXB04_11555 [Kiritimatiellae bacterium]|nr:hypothetical protein [Kiritimatiellia bacterium]